MAHDYIKEAAAAFSGNREAERKVVTLTGFFVRSVPSGPPDSPAPARKPPGRTKSGRWSSGEHSAPCMWVAADQGDAVKPGEFSTGEIDLPRFAAVASTSFSFQRAGYGILAVVGEPFQRARSRPVARFHRGHRGGPAALIRRMDPHVRLPLNC